jgi:hypothetical protein
MALHLVVDLAEAHLADGIIGPHDAAASSLPDHGNADRDFDTMRDVLFRDNDVLILFDPLMDGAEIPDGELDRVARYANLHPRDWFKPSRSVEQLPPADHLLRSAHNPECFLRRGRPLAHLQRSRVPRMEGQHRRFPCPGAEAVFLVIGGRKKHHHRMRAAGVRCVRRAAHGLAVASAHPEAPIGVDVPVPNERDSAVGPDVHVVKVSLLPVGVGAESKALVLGLRSWAECHCDHDLVAVVVEPTEKHPTRLERVATASLGGHGSDRRVGYPDDRFLHDSQPGCRLTRNGSADPGAAVAASLNE